MGAAHTAGPWKHLNEHPQNAVAVVIVEATPWNQIATLYNSPSSPQQPAGDGMWPDDPERDANARLIAAAPDMHGALIEAAQAAQDAYQAALAEVPEGSCIPPWITRLEQAAERAHAVLVKADARFKPTAKTEAA